MVFVEDSFVVFLVLEGLTGAPSSLLLSAVAFLGLQLFCVPFGVLCSFPGVGRFPGGDFVSAGRDPVCEVLNRLFSVLSGGGRAGVEGVDPSVF